MVVAALGALAGYGLQAYGADAKTQAAERARIAYNTYLRQQQSVQGAQDAQLQAMLQQLGGRYNQDVVGLVDQYQPAARVGAFNQGDAAQRGNIEKVLAVANQRNSPFTPTSNGLFANAQAQEAQLAEQRARPSIDAAAMGGGLTAMSERDNRLASDFGAHANEYNRKIQDAMRLYGLSNAARNQALERSALQHQQDMSQAQLAGNGAMLAGGLVSAGAQAYGSYQANQPTTPAYAGDPSMLHTSNGGYQ